MWGSGVEWVSLLYIVVSGILSKLAQDKKALQRTDIRDALMQLLHLLREWHRAAQMTNWILEDWSQKGKPADYEQLANAMQHQYNAVEHVLYVAGYPFPNIMIRFGRREVRSIGSARKWMIETF